jgi:hypothetical protein
MIQYNRVHDDINLVYESELSFASVDILRYRLRPHPCRMASVPHHLEINSFEFRCTSRLRQTGNSYGATTSC